jgi:hypothetical protein
MRAELAEKTEALDAERSMSQATITELTEKLSTSTTTAESATERAADLETRLAAAVAAREEAEARLDEMDAQLEHARSDADVLRTQAASIGDELAATQAALDQARRTSDEAQHLVADARRDADAARADAEAASARADAAAVAARADAWQPPVVPEVERVLEPVLEPVLEEVAFVAPEERDVEPSAPSFDRALADAFGQVAAAEFPAPVSPADATDVVSSTPAFRIAEPLTPRVRSGGPVVDLEASLVRELAPVEAAEGEEGEINSNGVAAETDEGEAPRERKPEPAWRRTAMAELTALATDTDDLTPRRRR